MTAPIDETHSPDLDCWVESARGHADFPVQNLPLGVFSVGEGPRTGGVAIGEMILDLSAAAQSPLLEGEARLAAEAASGATLNPLLALGAGPRRALRRRLSALLCDPGARAAVEAWLRPAAEATLHLPATIGDYTDFYAGIQHAENVGRLFRPDNPLLPNYKWVPIGYHGRASSIRISGGSVIRPNGQLKAPDAEAPVFGPSKRLDLELELGVWISGANALGEPVPIGRADERIAGLCLLNDWSARDVQAWEYQPLGPFLSKSLHTTISPWIVTAEALAPFRVAQPARPEGDPQPLPYLWDEADQRTGAYAVEVEAFLTTAESRRRGLAPHRLTKVPATSLYWTLAQLVTHHASNGCNLSAGDLFGTGTISGPQESSFGSLLEITAGGKRSITLQTGETRTFLEDGDEIMLSARASVPNRIPIGFGECRGTVVPNG